MKIEVLLGNQPVREYVLGELTMPDFEGWEGSATTGIPLCELSKVVKGLKPVDEIGKYALTVKPFLPPQVIASLKKDFPDHEALTTPPVDRRLAITAVAEEILRNHQPPDKHQVRFSQ